MSRGFVKEGDQEEVPMVLPRAFLPSGTPNYVTPEGLKKLHDEMESLKKDWIEAGTNYVAKNHIDAKMRQLSERINSAVVIDNTKANPDVVSFGMYVKYNDKVIRIVGVDEADASQGLISFISPIAKSLIGKKKGDKFEVKVPRGTEIVEVQDVNTHPTQTTNQHESTRTNISVNSCTLVDKNTQPTQTTNQHESPRTNISANSCTLVDKTTHPTQTKNQHESARTNISANSCTLVDKTTHPTQTTTQYESPRTNISVNPCTLVDKDNHPTQTTNQHESPRTNISANSCTLVDKNTQPTQTTNQHESPRTNLSANSCTLVDKTTHPTQTSTQHESPRTNISVNSCTLVDKNTQPTQTTNQHESPRTNLSANSCTLVDKTTHPTQTTNQHETPRTNISANLCTLVDKTNHPTQTSTQHESPRTNISVNSCALVDKDNHPTQTTNQHESPRTNISANSCTLVDKDNLTDDESTKIVQLPQNDFTEFLPIVNERGNIIGRALHLEIHNGNKVMHPAVHLLVYNTKKEIVAKYWWHVAFGETPEKTLKRKLKEIESQTIKPKFKKQYIREDKNEKELVSVFTATTDEEIIPSPSDKEYEAMFLKSTN